MSGNAAARSSRKAGKDAATFANPRPPLDVLEGSERFRQAASGRDVSELVGVTRIS